MECKESHQLEFTEEQLVSMRDSVYGYNDELANAILGGRNAGEYVLGHIENFNFTDNFDYLYQDRFKHEFAHLLLGLSFLKRNRNPLPFEYGYDGNEMAESLIIPIESLFERPPYDQKYKKDYVSTALETFNLSKGQVNFSSRVATEFCNSWDVPISIFEMRKRNGFVCPLKGPFRLVSTPQKIDKKTKWGEKTYRGQTLPRHIAESFYDDVKPVLKLVQRNFQQLLDDESIPIDDSTMTRGSYMKIIPVNILWDVMNDPDLADTIDLNHQQLLTWEFVIRHVAPVQQVFTKFRFLQNDDARLKSLNSATRHSGAYVACNLMQKLSWPMEKLCMEIHDIRQKKLEHECENRAKSMDDVTKLVFGDYTSFSKYGMSMIQNGVEQTYRDIRRHRDELKRIITRKREVVASTPSP